MTDSVFCFNDTIELKWCSYGDNGLFDITYSLDSGITNTIIVQNYPSTNSGFKWNASFSLYTNQWVMLTVRNPNDSNIFDNYWVFLERCPVGIEGNSEQLGSLLVYPNPAKSIINFELLYLSDRINGELQLFNSIGKKVLSKQIRSSHIKIDISEYSKGIYFYRLLNEKRKYSGKIFVN